MRRLGLPGQEHKFSQLRSTYGGLCGAKMSDALASSYWFCYSVTHTLPFGSEVVVALGYNACPCLTKTRLENPLHLTHDDLGTGI